MSRHLSNFEQSIKNSLEGAELPYESGSWESLSNELDKIDNADSSKKKFRFFLAAGILLTLGTSYFLLNTNNDSPAQNIVTNTEIKANPLKTGSATKMDNAKPFQDLKNKKVQNTVVINSNELSEKKTNEQKNDTPKSVTNNLNTSSSKTSEKTIVNEKTSKDELVVKNDIKNNTNNKQFSNNILSFAPNVIEACAGTEISFEVSSKEIEGSFLWNFGDGNFSNDPNPRNIYTKAGNYTITLAITSSEDGVIKSNNKPVIISILPKPTAKFDWEFVSEYKEVPTIKLTNQSLNATTTEWTLDENEKSNEINMLKSFKNKGEHLINLTVVNENGCSDTKYKYINIENDYNLLAPKTFSPDNDGKSDTFLPGSLRVLGKEFEMSIYKNEQVIYSTSNTNEAWDGTYNKIKAKSGEKFPWVVILYDNDGNKQYYSGIVTVVP